MHELLSKSMVVSKAGLHRPQLRSTKYIGKRLQLTILVPEVGLGNNDATNYEYS